MKAASALMAAAFIISSLIAVFFMAGAALAPGGQSVPETGEPARTATGEFVFSLRCPGSPAYMQLWGDWNGAWSANQTNETPVGGEWWNVAVGGMPDGDWTWGALCNDTDGNYAWSGNASLAVDSSPPADITIVPLRCPMILRRMPVILR